MKERLPPKIKKGMVPLGNHPLEISQLIPDRKDPGILVDQIQ